MRIQGGGSLLDLSQLTTLTNGTSFGSDITLEALTGGMIDLSGVTEIIDPATGDLRARAVRITADGIGSTIDLQTLSSFQDLNADDRSTMTARHGGIINVNLNQISVVLVDVTAGPNGTIDGSLDLVSGARLFGQGSVGNDVVNGSEFSLTEGNAFNIGGDYIQMDAGTLNIDLAGLTPGILFGQLTVDGSVTLTGTLNVALADGFVPVQGDEFRIISTSSVTGIFTTTSFPTLPGNLAFDIIVDGLGVLLKVVSS